VIDCGTPTIDHGYIVNPQTGDPTIFGSSMDYSCNSGWWLNSGEVDIFEYSGTIECIVNSTDHSQGMWNTTPCLGMYISPHSAFY